MLVRVLTKPDRAHQKILEYKVIKKDILKGFMGLVRFYKRVKRLSIGLLPTLEKRYSKYWWTEDQEQMFKGYLTNLLRI